MTLLSLYDPFSPLQSCRTLHCKAAAKEQNHVGREARVLPVQCRDLSVLLLVGILVLLLCWSCPLQTGLAFGAAKRCALHCSSTRL